MFSHPRPLANLQDKPQTTPRLDYPLTGELGFDELSKEPRSTRLRRSSEEWTRAQAAPASSTMPIVSCNMGSLSRARLASGLSAGHPSPRSTTSVSQVANSERVSDSRTRARTAAPRRQSSMSHPLSQMKGDGEQARPNCRLSFSVGHPREGSWSSMEGDVKARNARLPSGRANRLVGSPMPDVRSLQVMHVGNTGGGHGLCGLLNETPSQGRLADAPLYKEAVVSYEQQQFHMPSERRASKQYYEVLPVDQPLEQSSSDETDDHKAPPGPECMEEAQPAGVPLEPKGDTTPLDTPECGIESLLEMEGFLDAASEEEIQGVLGAETAEPGSSDLVQLTLHPLCVEPRSEMQAVCKWNSPPEQQDLYLRLYYGLSRVQQAPLQRANRLLATFALDASTGSGSILQFESPEQPGGYSLCLMCIPIDGDGEELELVRSHFRVGIPLAHFGATFSSPAPL